MIISIFNEGNREEVFNVADPESKAKAIRVALFGFLTPWGVIDTGVVSASIDPFLDVVLFGIMKRSEETY